MSEDVCSPYLDDEQAFDFIRGLLQRDPHERLGYNGFQEVKQHAWFKDIEWDKLLRKEIKPPYKPIVEGEADSRNIEQVFSPVCGPSVGVFGRGTSGNAHSSQCCVASEGIQ